LLGQLLVEKLVLSGSEGTFAVTLEDLPNRHAGPAGNLFVQINEGDAGSFGHGFAQRGLAGPHHAAQKDHSIQHGAAL
jgi:hypothetical protein